MGDRQELVRRAFAALDSGDIEPFRQLLAPDAKWVAIPQGADVAETPTCASGAAIVDGSTGSTRTGVGSRLASCSRQATGLRSR